MLELSLSLPTRPQVAFAHRIFDICVGGRACNYYVALLENVPLHMHSGIG